MDKQDFQEQDFMEFLMRLPCPHGKNRFPSRGETITLTRAKYSLREENIYQTK